MRLQNVRCRSDGNCFFVFTLCIAMIFFLAVVVVVCYCCCSDRLYCCRYGFVILLYNQKISIKLHENMTIFGTFNAENRIFFARIPLDFHWRSLNVTASMQATTKTTNIHTHTYCELSQTFVFHLLLSIISEKFSLYIHIYNRLCAPIS